MTYKALITTALVAAFSAGAASADSTVTSRVNYYTVVSGGTTYADAFGTSVEGEFALAKDFYANVGFEYLTAYGLDAYGYDAGVSYKLVNDLDTNAGTGYQLGAGVNLSGTIQFTGAAALSTDFVADASATTSLNSFGTAVSYGVGLEYVPIGLYASYDALEVPGSTVAVRGVGLGYRSRF